MNKKQLIENMENVMMDLVKGHNDYKHLMSASELKDSEAKLEAELKTTAKAYNFLLNRTYKNNSDRISPLSWVYETMLAEKEIKRG